MITQHTRPNIFELVKAQLPEALHSLFRIEVFTDPYLLRTEVVFYDAKDEQVISTALQYDTMADGRQCACKLPDAVISFLCLRAPHLPKRELEELQAAWQSVNATPIKNYRSRAK